MIETCISPYRAAQILGCSYEFVRQQCIKGRIRGARKIGERWFIPASSPSLPGNRIDADMPPLPPDADADARVERMREIARRRKQESRRTLKKRHRKEPCHECQP